MRGKNLRIHCADFWDSSLEGGEMTFWDTYWLTTSSTGSTRYALASCHPNGRRAIHKREQPIAGALYMHTQPLSLQQPLLDDGLHSACTCKMLSCWHGVPGACSLSKQWREPLNLQGQRHKRREQGAGLNVLGLRFVHPQMGSCAAP